MTSVQIVAFLLFLSSFGVDQPTIDKVQAILQPATTTAITATTTLTATPDGGANVSTPVINTPQTVQPTFGGTITAMAQTQADIRVTSYPDEGGFSFKVEVLDDSGNNVKAAPVEFIDSNGTSSRPTLSRTIEEKNDWFTNFRTAKPGQVTFKSGSLTKTLNLQ